MGTDVTTPQAHPSDVGWARAVSVALARSRGSFTFSSANFGIAFR